MNWYNQIALHGYVFKDRNCSFENKLIINVINMILLNIRYMRFYDQILGMKDWDLKMGFKWKSDNSK